MVAIPLTICFLAGIEGSTFCKTDNPMKVMIDGTCFPTDEEEQPEEAVEDLDDILDGHGTIAMF